MRSGCIIATQQDVVGFIGHQNFIGKTSVESKDVSSVVECTSHLAGLALQIWIALNGIFVLNVDIKAVESNYFL